MIGDHQDMPQPCGDIGSCSVEVRFVPAPPMPASSPSRGDDKTHVDLQRAAESVTRRLTVASPIKHAHLSHRSTSRESNSSAGASTVFVATLEEPFTPSTVSSGSAEASSVVSAAVRKANLAWCDTPPTSSPPLSPPTSAEASGKTSPPAVKGLALAHGAAKMQRNQLVVTPRTVAHTPTTPGRQAVARNSPRLHSPRSDPKLQQSAPAMSPEELQSQQVLAQNQGTSRPCTTTNGLTPRQVLTPRTPVLREEREKRRALVRKSSIPDSKDKSAPQQTPRTDGRAKDMTADGRSRDVAAVKAAPLRKENDESQEAKPKAQLFTSPKQTRFASGTFECVDANEDVARARKDACCTWARPSDASTDVAAAERRACGRKASKGRDPMSHSKSPVPSSTSPRTKQVAHSTTEPSLRPESRAPQRFMNVRGMCIATTRAEASPAPKPLPSLLASKCSSGLDESHDKLRLSKRHVHTDASHEHGETTVSASCEAASDVLNASSPAQATPRVKHRGVDRHGFRSTSPRSQRKAAAPSPVDTSASARSRLKSTDARLAARSRLYEDMGCSSAPVRPPEKMFRSMRNVDAMPLSARTLKRAATSVIGLSPSENRVSDAIMAALKDDGVARRYARECFVAFDKDKNGKLSFDELRDCMRHLNLNLQLEEFRPRDVEYYMRRFDANSDNQLSCSEFEEVYRHMLLMKLNAEEHISFDRAMFLGIRKGNPSDHYQVVSKVGRGTYGIVEKVACRATGALRVMKTIDKQKAERGGLSAKLVMDEIEKLKCLDHPAVLRLFEYFVGAKALHLITDILPGGDLASAVDKSLRGKCKSLAETWVRTVFRQVCEGVAYIHEKGIMHKDLKLENIVLARADDPPEAVIIDVGLAEIFPADEAEVFRSKEVAGTLATMAPEVIARSFTYKCDVWSLGCCLYALICEVPIVYHSPEDFSEELYPYPWPPPEDESVTWQLEDYVRRQIRGPDMTRTKCWECARHLARRMLAIGEKIRPTVAGALMHEWFQEPSSDKIQKNVDGVLKPNHLDCLMHFSNANALEEAVLLDVASQAPIGELRELRGIFEQLDQDGNGRLDVEELTEALELAGLDSTQAQQFARRFALDGSVEFSRFVAALVPSDRGLLASHLRAAFDRLDVNGDGYVSAAELRQLVVKTKTSRTSRKTAQAVQSIFDALGGQQRISFRQLQKYFVELCV
eukprot:TRINITY_DN16678_c0_g1_i3.p1 TRINITY_DN16678_c0_g1~~TRINITY_DN16678_c0_g1_i3.p1  ORF type:complete len:1196 (+),score=191.21 TRINITY_DN16678_c0_g1_i3:48-3635(+)